MAGAMSFLANLPVHLGLPSWSLFKFPPVSEPAIVPAPTSEFTYAPPFEIPQKLFNHLLSSAYPVTFALLYYAAVSYLSRLNRERGNKPWPLSKTKLFFLAVVAHNLLLAAYSGWTLKGMLQALRHSWPGWPGQHGVEGVVDALCKIHGPRGLGNAVAFNTTTNIWTSPNVAVKLAPRGIPDSTDLGRLWNEGLGFYGWLFYVSKFYELFDTAILLAKGKIPSTLQTFHHAGALISLWAGIRYMSPPIWMWVLLNSGVHTIMYTYYALTALAVPVARSIKPLITTLQISQFLVGAAFALAHLFVSYSVPFSVPYTVVPSVSSAISAASSVASTAATSVATVASSAGIGNLLRKVVLRAAGEEGLAENVPLRNHGPVVGVAESLAEMVKEAAKPEVRYTTEDQRVPCIDTSGQAFAIWLNLLYLVPLTYLFMRFFSRSYLNRTSSDTSHPTKSSLLGKAGHDAAKGVQRELKEEPVPLLEQTESVAKVARDTAETFVTKLENEAVADGQSIKAKAKELGNKAAADAEAISKGAKDLGHRAAAGGESIKKGAKDLANKAAAGGESIKNGAKDLANKAAAGGESIKNGAKNLGNRAAASGESIKETAKDLGNKAATDANSMKEKVKELDRKLEEKVKGKPDGHQATKDGADDGQHNEANRANGDVMKERLNKLAHTLANGSSKGESPKEEVEEDGDAPHDGGDEVGGEPAADKDTLEEPSTPESSPDLKSSTPNGDRPGDSTADEADKNKEEQAPDDSKEAPTDDFPATDQDEDSATAEPQQDGSAKPDHEDTDQAPTSGDDDAAQDGNGENEADDAEDKDDDEAENQAEAEAEAAKNPERSLILAEADEDKQLILVE